MFIGIWTFLKIGNNNNEYNVCDNVNNATTK